jgi:hypothetical protein
MKMAKAESIYKRRWSWGMVIMRVVHGNDDGSAPFADAERRRMLVMTFGLDDSDVIMTVRVIHLGRTR